MQKEQKEQKEQKDLSVQKIPGGRYVINDSVMVFDIGSNSEGITYSVNYDETVDAETAENLAHEFFERVFKNQQ